MGRLLSRLSLVAGLLLVASPAVGQSLPSGNPATPEKVRFYHPDALGSVRAVTDIGGDIVSRSDYLPFGEQIPPEQGRADVAGYSDDAGNKQKFTGKERDIENGLDYFGARYFSAPQGRFTSADPFTGFSALIVKPQRWNRYAYVSNNPLALVDPDGREEFHAEWLAERDRLIALHGNHPLTPEQAKADRRLATAIFAPLAVLAAPAMIEAALALGPALWTEAQIAGGSCVASAGCRGAIGDLAEGLSGAPPRSLSFGATDLVYGPYAGGATRRLAENVGGRLLDEVGVPAVGQTWAQFSFQTLEGQLAEGGMVRFDLTNVKNLKGILKGTGEYAESTTSQELRYLRENWRRFKNNVKFYQDGAEVSAPW